MLTYKNFSDYIKEIFYRIRISDKGGILKDEKKERTSRDMTTLFNRSIPARRVDQLCKKLDFDSHDPEGTYAYLKEIGIDNIAATIVDEVPIGVISRKLKVNQPYLQLWLEQPAQQEIYNAAKNIRLKDAADETFLEAMENDKDDKETLALINTKLKSATGVTNKAKANQNKSVKIGEMTMQFISQVNMPSDSFQVDVDKAKELELKKLNSIVSDQ